VIKDRDCYTTTANLILLVVNGITLLACLFEFRQELVRIRDGSRSRRRQTILADECAHCRNRETR